MIKGDVCQAKLEYSVLSGGVFVSINPEIEMSASGLEGGAQPIAGCLLVTVFVRSSWAFQHEGPWEWTGFWNQPEVAIGGPAI